MKLIENKKTSILKSETDKSCLDYRELIKSCLDMTPQGGFSFEDLTKRARIDAALKKSKNGKIELEDADYENLKSIVKEMRWLVRHNDILEFTKTILNEK